MESHDFRQDSGIRRTDLGHIPAVYAIGTIDLDGQTYVIAASEKKDGPAFLINPVSGTTETIWEGPGGVMAMIGCSGGRILSIDEFYPVFDSAKAAVYVTEVKGSVDHHSFHKRKLFDLPWCHRVAYVHESDGDFIIAASLCKEKKFVEDWSTKGSVYAVPVSADFICEGNLEPIISEKIEKNHALWVHRNADGTDDIYVGGTEGIFCITRNNGFWSYSQILNIPTSDIAVGDLDGDGKDEIAVIEGFHGSTLEVFKEDEAGFRPVASCDFEFGHVLQISMINGKNRIILGSRAGEKFLEIVDLIHTEDGYSLLKTAVDTGVGPAQAIIVPQNDSAIIYAADHGVDTVAAYYL